MINMQNLIDNATYLSIEEFGLRFDSLWENMKISFYKFENLQYYDESNDSPMFDLIDKNYNNFCEKLLHNKEEERSFYISALSKGISLKRLHFIDFPISKYIEFEYYSYYISNSLGENIKYNNSKEYKNQLLKDFVLFDSEHILIHDYDKDGKLKGGWYLSNKQYLEELNKWYNYVFEKSKSFESIMLPKKEILEKIL